MRYLHRGTSQISFMCVPSVCGHVGGGVGSTTRATRGEFGRAETRAIAGISRAAGKNRPTEVSPHCRGSPRLSRLHRVDAAHRRARPCTRQRRLLFGTLTDPDTPHS